MSKEQTNKQLYATLAAAAQHADLDMEDLDAICQIAESQHEGEKISTCAMLELIEYIIIGHDDSILCWADQQLGEALENPAQRSAT